MAVPDLGSADLSVAMDASATDLSVLDLGAVNGVDCTTASQCASGFCVDGKCCDTACDSACQACSAALTGRSDGTCAPETDGKNDARGVCVASQSSTCGLDGTCKAGACAYWSTSTACGAAASCSGQMLTGAGHCDGQGTCAAGTTAACPNNFKCNAGGTACLSACSSANDCATGGCTNPGVSGTCGPLAAGTACTSNAQCASFVCDIAGNGHCFSAECSVRHVRCDRVRQLGCMRVSDKLHRVRLGFAVVLERAAHVGGRVRRRGQLRHDRRRVPRRRQVRERDRVSGLVWQTQ